MKVVFMQSDHQAPCTAGKLLRKTLFCVFWLLTILLYAPVLYAQTPVHVKGHITDENGNAVAGATIQVRGTATGVVSDENGNFEIVAPDKSTLVISYTGFQSRTFPASSSPLTVVLSALQNSLDQVIVVGYGTQKKRDVTGAVVSIKEDALRSVPSTSLVQAMQGQAAGLDIQTVGTKPGDGGQIRIRGYRSIYGSNEPLLVLDGIPYDGSLNDINPGDVASVEILKDASATAIYGSRGSNGVILVTTKRGRAGAARVSYSGFYGIGNAEYKYPVFSAAEYQAMRNRSNWALGYEPEELQSIARGTTTDWQDQLYKSSMKTDNNITVSGGSAGSTYSLGGGYHRETTVIPGQDFTRYSLRGTIDTKIGKRVKVGLNTLNSVNITNGSQLINPMFDILALSPLMPAYDSTGNLLYSPWEDNDDRNAKINPLYLVHHGPNSWVDRIRRLRTFNSLYGEYQIIDGLKYRINLGLSYAQEENDQFWGTNSPLTPNYVSVAKRNTLSAVNGASINNTDTWGYTAENLLIYDKTFSQKHHLNFTGLYSIQEYHQHNTFLQKDTLTDDFTQFYDLALSPTVNGLSVNGGEQSSVLLSYMGRINYSFEDRYMLTVTYRADGSSRLAEGHKWHYYPAVSAGWNISNEKFMHIGWLDHLKLRAGFGQTSNQAVTPYSSLGLVSNGNGLNAPGNIIRYNYGPTVVTGYNIITLPNPNLDWEYTKTINVGLDFALLKNRITGALDYYHEQTNKILTNITLPPTSGVSGSYQINVGEMENQGVELSLSTVNIQPARSDGFEWTTDLNLFFNRNKLLKLYSGFEQDIKNQLFVGHSINSIFDYNKQGIYQLNEAAEAAQYGATPGQIKLEDHSGPTGKPDGTIDPDNDRYVIGTADPKLQGGMTNRFAYRNFDLSVVAYARFGGLLISQLHQPFASYLTTLDGRRTGIRVDYWTPTNPSNWFPDPAAVSTSGTAGYSPISTAWTTLGYYKATFVQIRAINLGYSFGNAVLKKLNAESLRVYFTVDNVATLFSPFKNQTGVDPVGTGLGSQGVSDPGNIRANTNGNGAITVAGDTPPLRTFIFGINLSF
jgi:TonB-linked SusC/RagA family outer membrane protein